MKEIFHSVRHNQVEYKNASKVTCNQITCGYCGNQIAPDYGYSISTHEYAPIYIYRCPCCDNPIIYNAVTKVSYPGEPFGREVKGLPENIQTLYDECRTCYANQCYTSSQMIARTLLMHIAVEQGAQAGDTFAAYINYLDSNGYIPPQGRAWVDFIRQSGNVANHQIVIKEKEETEKVITFLSSLLLFIYELPAEMSQGGTP